MTTHRPRHRQLVRRALPLQATASAAFLVVVLASACSGKTSSESPAQGGTAGTASGGTLSGGSGGSAVGGSGGSNVGGTGGGVVNRALGECTQATPILVAGVDTGTVRCEGPFLQRVSAGTCPVRVPRAGVQDGDPNGECLEDSHCVARPLGWCGRPPGDWQASPACQYGCETDDDCAAGELCACHESTPAGVCVAATCKTSDDCPGAALCVGRSVSVCGDDPNSPVSKVFSCQQPDDECTARDECPQDSYVLCLRGACEPGAGACGGGR